MSVMWTDTEAERQRLIKSLGEPDPSRNYFAPDGCLLERAGEGVWRCIRCRAPRVNRPDGQCLCEDCLAFEARRSYPDVELRSLLETIREACGADGAAVLEQLAEHAEKRAGTLARLAREVSK